MLLALVAVLLMLLTGVIALVGAYFIARRERLDIEKRINLIAQTRRVAIADTSLSAWFDKFAKRIDRLIQNFFVLGIAHRWGISRGSMSLLMTAGVVIGVVWLLGLYALEMSSSVSLLIGCLLGYYIPRRMLKGQQRKAERRFDEQFPDAIDTVVRVLRSGLPATAALRTVGEDLPQPVGSVFSTIAHQMRIGIPLGEALKISSERIALPDFRFFTVALNLQFATGGNLVCTLETLSSIIRKQRAVKNKAKAVTSEIRMTAYVLGSLPFLVTGALLLIQPEYLKPLLYDSRGHIVLGMACAGLLASMLTMKKMMESVTNG